MIRGATRGVFRSARQAARASRRQNGSRTVNTMAREESLIGARQQRQAFGRMETDTIAKALSVVLVELTPGRQLVDVLTTVMSELAAEDDDGR